VSTHCRGELTWIEQNFNYVCMHPKYVHVVERVLTFLSPQKHQDSYSGLGLMYLEGMGLEQVICWYTL